VPATTHRRGSCCASYLRLLVGGRASLTVRRRTCAVSNHEAYVQTPDSIFKQPRDKRRSLRATGSRECAPPDERNGARVVMTGSAKQSSGGRVAPRNATRIVIPRHRVSPSASPMTGSAKQSVSLKRKNGLLRRAAPRNDVKSRHTPRMRGIQYAAAPRFHHKRLGILDRPPEPVIGRRYAPTRWRTMTGGDFAGDDD
jgi:hypothetical protein